MSRSSRRRKKRSRRQPDRESRAGSMMSMRSGFRRLAGSERTPRQRGNAFLGWMIALVFAIILVLWLIR